MSGLSRIVLVRHGETDGESSIRFHGSGDVPLSEDGRAHMHEVARGLAQEFFDLVVASPLSRAWESARILSGGAPVRIESDFREIDFGRWEGLTVQEIEAADPVLYRDWQARIAGFEFPGGEQRADFRKRVLRGLEGLEESGARSALVVVHKGVVRTIAEQLVGSPLPEGEPQLGGCVGISRGADDVWRVGRRSSDPEPLR